MTDVAQDYAGDVIVVADDGVEKITLLDQPDLGSVIEAVQDYAGDIIVIADDGVEPVTIFDQPN